jgi:hypothetical protein
VIIPVESTVATIAFELSKTMPEGVGTDRLSDVAAMVRGILAVAGIVSETRSVAFTGATYNCSPGGMFEFAKTLSDEQDIERAIGTADSVIAIAERMRSGTMWVRDW